MYADNCYVRVTGEPFLSRCAEYLRNFKTAQQAAWDYAESIGATTFFWLPGRKGINAVKFDGEAPKGWKKPSHKGISTPYVSNTEARNAIANLPRFPSIEDDVLGEGTIPESYEAKGFIDGEEQDEMGVLSLQLHPQLSWTPDKFFLILPDIPNWVKAYKEAYPGMVLQGNIAFWTWPEGLERVSDEQYEYEMAKAKLEEKNRNDAKAA